MKRYFFLLFTIGLVLFYNSNKVAVNHLWHLVVKPRDLYQPIFYKDIKTEKDLEGKYKFVCKYPEGYEVGLGIKKEILPSPFNKIKKSYNPNIRFKINILSKNKIIYSKNIIKITEGSAWYYGLDYYKNLGLLEFPISDCNDLEFQISNVKGSFNIDDKDLFYLYVSVSPLP